MGNYMSADPPRTKWSFLHHEMIKLGEDMEVEFDDAEGGLLSQQNCPKKKYHAHMIPITDLTLENLPAAWRSPFVLAYLLDLSSQAVRIKVPYISPHRPDGYPLGDCKGKRIPTVGTGFATINVDVLRRQEPIACSLENCTEPKPHRVTPVFLVQTATHVIFDNIEAKEASVEFFYNSQTSLVVQAHAIEVNQAGLHGDNCWLRCVSHDLTLFDQLVANRNRATATARALPRASILPPVTSPRAPLVVVVAHPHGTPKRVSFGDWLEYGEKIPSDNEMQYGATYVREYLDFRKKIGPAAWSQCSDNFFSPQVILQLEQAVRENPNLKWREYFQMRQGDMMGSQALTSIRYTAATCPGSSGASVFVLCEKPDGGFGRGIQTTHFRGGRKSRAGYVNVSGYAAVVSECRKQVADHLDTLALRKKVGKK